MWLICKINWSAFSVFVLDFIWKLYISFFSIRSNIFKFGTPQKKNLILFNRFSCPFYEGVPCLRSNFFYPELFPFKFSCYEALIIVICEWICNHVSKLVVRKVVEPCLRSICNHALSEHVVVFAYIWSWKQMGKI